MRLANSAAYQRIKPAESVTQAASYLGFQRSRMIALSATLLPALVNSKQPSFCYTAFWRRSLVAGACARAIAHRLFPEDTESLFLAALLQDIGILALAQLPLEIYDGIDCEDYAHERAVQAERRMIREDHGSVGAWLLERWNFPARLVGAVRVSNNPALLRTGSDGVDFSAGVMAAGLMADTWMWRGAPPDLTVLQSDIYSLLGIAWREVLDLFTEASSEIPLVEALCGVQVTDAPAMALALSVLRDTPVSDGPESNGPPPGG